VDVRLNRPSFGLSSLRLAAALCLLLAFPGTLRATCPVPGGVLPEAVRQAFASGALDVPPPAPLSTSGVAVAQTAWRVPILMVAFSDLPFTYTPPEFDAMLFDSTGANPYGSAFEYWRWASGGRLRLTGRVVATVTLPHDLSYYGFNYWGLRLTSTPNNIFGAIRDALTACEASVDWSEFDMDRDGYVDMLWVLHAGPGGEAQRDYNSFWSITSRLTGGWSFGEAFKTSDPVPGSTTQFMRIDRFSTVPEQSALIPGRRSEIGVYCHEFGHALGWPDLFDTSELGGAANVGPGYWGLMAMGGFGTNGVTPESPSHPGAWPLKMLGWQTVIRPAHDTTIVIAPLSEGGPAVDVAFEGEPLPEHLMIENRQRLGFDRFLLSEGLILYQMDDAILESRYATNRVNTGLKPGLKIVEGDGDDDMYLGHNRGDASDPLPGDLGVTRVDEDTSPSSDTFAGAPSGVALLDVTPVGDSMRVTLRVRAPGWQPPSDQTEAGYAPVEAPGPARAAVLHPDGTLEAAASDARSGIPRIALRTRRAGVWSPSLILSDPGVPALSPSLAALPGGDLAVAWSETRAGVSRIVYRARVKGGWTEPRTLSRLASDAYRPSLAADAHGIVYATWLQVVGMSTRVEFMRFAYASPFGAAYSVTDSTQSPDDPSVSASPSGRAYLVWVNRAAVPQRLWFARFEVDSGLSARLPLTYIPLHDQVTYSALADAQDGLNVAWFENARGVSEIHVQRRTVGPGFWYPDSIIELRNESLQNAVLEADPQGALHLAYEAFSTGGQRVRYKRWRPGFGWDSRSTEVSHAAEGYVSRPWVLPVSPGRVTILYNATPVIEPRFRSRERTLDPAPPTAVASNPAIREAALAAGPNPVRRGQALELRLVRAAAALAGPLEIEWFDVSGRRIERTSLARVGDAWVGRLEADRSARWPAGIYFARVRGDRDAGARIVLMP
jgi:immune inhibitor A